MIEIVVKIILTLTFCWWLWTHQLNPREMVVHPFSKRFKEVTEVFAELFPTKNPDHIYQNGKPVGRISGEVKEEINGKIIFQEIYDTADLKQDLPFEWKRERFRILSMESSKSFVLQSDGIKQWVLDRVVCERVR